MKATDELKNEHEGIKIMLQVLQATAQRMEQGAEVNSGHLDGMLEFLTVFIDRCHHGKEEEFLFPALEVAGVLRENGPIGVMLSEHEQGRQLVAKLKKALAERQSGGLSSAESVRSIIEDYTALLTQHIDKENTILFAMADALLDSNKDSELVSSFEQLERDRIGAGKHEAFHALLDQLQQEYLS